MTLEPGDVARDLFGPHAQAADHRLVELSRSSTKLEVAPGPARAASTSRSLVDDPLGDPVNATDRARHRVGRDRFIDPIVRAAWSVSVDVEDCPDAAR